MGAMTIWLTYPTFVFVGPDQRYLRSHRWPRYAERHHLRYADTIIISTYLCGSDEILWYVTVLSYL